MNRKETNNFMEDKTTWLKITITLRKDNATNLKNLKRLKGFTFDELMEYMIEASYFIEGRLGYNYFKNKKDSEEISKILQLELKKKFETQSKKITRGFEHEQDSIIESSSPSA